MTTNFSDQVQLLVQLLPLVAKQSCFALKGGTAINLFVRDMPRLSVDIDLVYLPVEDRNTSLRAIDAALASISEDIERLLPGSLVTDRVLRGTTFRQRLVVQRSNTTVKMEVTPVLRGSLFPPAVQVLSPSVQQRFGYAEMQVLSFEELYAGKICAALDRQHPRDLFDVKLLLENEGITEDLKNAFLVYLMAHNRPMVELLAPNEIDITDLYHAEFEGMVNEAVSLPVLLNARSDLVKALHARLSTSDKEFLLSVKRGDVDWSCFVFPQAINLPAIQWKLHNLEKMGDQKRREAVDKLHTLLLG